MSQLQVTGEAKIRDIQGPVVSNSGVITALDGDASQYVRGDGTLADFPTSTGGGSSVSYYLNSSVSQGTIGGVAYRQLGKTPIIGAGTDITISANGYVASYITDANDPALLEVPAGNFNCEFYFSVNSNAHNPFVYAEVYKYDGTTFSLIGTSVGVPEYLSNGTTLSPYYFAIPVSQTVLTITDRIAIRIYVNVDGRTVTLHTENGHLCQVVTTFSKGLTSLNNLTRQVQFLATGTSGTDFGISSSVATHTFNLPIASATNTGKLSSTDWSTFNGKVPYTGATAALDMGNNSITTNNFYYGKSIILDAGVEEVGGSVIFRQRAAASGPDTNYTTISAISNNILTFSFWQDAPSGINRYKFFSFRTDNLTIGTSRTYQMPDASGTLALTSNLSSYVPYTGATADVDLGSFVLSAGATSSNIVYANGSGSSSGILYLKQGTIAANFTGYNGIYATSTSYGFIADAGASYKLGIFSLASLTNNTTRTFTLPDLSGTLALLEGTQTFTGDKEFSGGAQFTNANGTYTQYGITLTKGSTPTGFFTSNVSIFSDAGVTNLVIANHPTYKSKLQFQDVATLTSNYTYTFPAASGTIALTSNLSSYVPYSGATASVNLGFNLLTTNSINLDGNSASGVLNIKSNSSITTSGAGYVSLVSGNVNQLSFVFNGGNSATFTSVSLSASRTYSLPDAGGTLALTSNLSAYLPLTGGTLTGALSGTSATFSSSVGVGGATNTLGFLEVWKSGSSIAQLSIGQNATYHTDFFVDTTGNFYVQPQGNTKLTILSGGNVGINTDSPDMLLTVDGKTGGGSTINLARFYASKGQSDAAYLQIQGVRHPTLSVQRIVLDAFNGAGSNVPLIFQQGGGNVLINTTSQKYSTKLEVNSVGDGISTRADNGGAALVCNPATTGSNSAFFQVGTTNAGSISHPTSSTTSFNTSPSDERLKYNIEEWNENVLESFIAIKPKTYAHIADDDETIRYKGYIAQEMIDKFPEAYPIDRDGFYNYNPSAMVVYLTKAIQEQQAQIEELKALINK